RSMATSRAARSTPVWPPLMIFMPVSTDRGTPYRRSRHITTGDVSSIGDGARLTALDNEPLPPRHPGLGVAPFRDRLEAGLHTLACEIDADVAPLAAVEEADVRVCGEHLEEALVGRSLRGDGGADELGGDRLRSRVGEVGLEVRRPERVDVAAKEH